MSPRDWLAYGNLHIPLIGGALILANTVLAGIPTPWPYVLLASAGAFLVYQFDRLVLIGPEDRINEPERVAWAAHHRTFTVLSITAALAVIAFSWPRVDPEVKFWIPVVGLLGLAYSLRIPGTARRLKQLAWIKSPVILFCWVAGTTTLLLAYGGEAQLESAGSAMGAVANGGGVIDRDSAVGIPGADVAILTLYRLLYLAPSVLLADFVDRKGDRSSGIRTVSQKLPLAGLCLWAMGSVAAATGVLAWLITRNELPLWAWLDATGLALTAVTMLRMRRPDGQTVLLLDLCLISPIIIWVISGSTSWGSGYIVLP